MLTRRAHRRPSLTIADICFAIKAGWLNATIDPDQHYRIRRGDLVRYARKASFGPQLELRPLSSN